MAWRFETGALITDEQISWRCSSACDGSHELEISAANRPLSSSVFGSPPRRARAGAADSRERSVCDSNVPWDRSGFVQGGCPSCEERSSQISVALGSCGNLPMTP